jgi:hypothetical protein
MSFVFFVVRVAATPHPLSETQVFRFRLFRSSLPLAARARTTAIVTSSYASSYGDTNDALSQVSKVALAQEGQEGVTVVPETDLAVLLMDTYLQVADCLSSSGSHVYEIQV